MFVSDQTAAETEGVAGTWYVTWILQEQLLREIKSRPGPSRVLSLQVTGSIFFLLRKKQHLLVLIVGDPAMSFLLLNHQVFSLTMT